MTLDSVLKELYEKGYGSQSATQSQEQKLPSSTTDYSFRNSFIPKSSVGSVLFHMTKQDTSSD